MKHLKYLMLLVTPVVLFSCVKKRNDLAGLLDDSGQVAISIKQAQYLNAPAAFGGNPADPSTGDNDPTGLQAHAHFNFADRPNEAVWFFTIHVAQPRDTKMSGDLTLKLETASSQSGLGLTDLPAGALSNPGTITIPQSKEDYFDYPVFLTVNKTLLTANTAYGIRFKLTSTNQGVITKYESYVDVIINSGDFFGLGSATDNTGPFQGMYKWTSSVTDPLNVYNATNNTRTELLVNLGNPSAGVNQYTHFAYVDGIANDRALGAFNITTGTFTTLFTPGYNVDATGKVTSIVNAAAGAAGTVTAITLDPSNDNKFTYTSSFNKTGSIKYSFTLTSGTNIRTMRVVENYSLWIYQIY